MLRRFLQETYVIRDAWFYDGGTISEHNDNWNGFTSEYISVTRANDGTTIAYSTATSRFTECIPKNNSTYLAIPLCIEFDLLDIDNYCLFQNVGRNSDSQTKYLGRALTQTGHYKIIITDTQYSISIDGVEKQRGSSGGVLSVNSDFVFDNQKGDSSIKYKDFVVYNI